MSPKLESLTQILKEHAPLAIAYSGGVDSAFLLAFAHKVLGEQMLGVIADSPSLPRQALADALALAQRLDIPVRILKTEEMEDPNYVNNPPNRCFFCKAELFKKMEALAQAEKFAAVAYGENADDALQVRPGRDAATQFAVIAPLKEAGLTKADIRAESRLMNLPTADIPAQPCLSSRIPHGTPVSLEALSMIERAEAYVRSLGFKVLRVRHISEPPSPPRARVQLAPEELPKAMAIKDEVVSGLRDVGYSDATIEAYTPPTPLPAL